ncbi:CPBP family intramembrane metalloprotease [Clostridium botulinum]|uniref:CPBP family intramembrane metalloprotease n=1 Tax=Clostridium botulinum TaxID=1491 RepID=A0A846J144_CLOBO|nr:CPBP family intramembrane glutamic endopeptidase [Clostridium botulinum]ACA54578.1 CAAX amino terminal protease family protein [Clostridium botulinum A3 str. Loch Maree]NFH64380.1 CPBP family intramembrane metalloprotease [Clostridium botulinum]NFJ07041.1 CPBP family intramembrane metalloprotease [Clostridium botulinum]NFK14013.1 CPBP family intramembrane metalloprotease [Clostridium botulinum]NFM92331.1 CPBP family intramembrane metalloprotease [Clostridium botulinum]
MDKSEVTENNFELSVLGALAIMMFTVVAVNFLPIHFNMMLETTYVNSHKVLELVLKVLGDIILKGLAIIFILKIIRADIEPSFKIKYIEKFNFKILLCTAFFILGFFMWFQNSIGIMLTKVLVSKETIEAFAELGQNPYQIFILQIIMAPIFEEIVLRGIILEGFLNKYKPITSIIVSSVIFGLWHGNIPQFITATILGILVGIIYYKTRSTVLCIVSHILNNGLTFLYINFNIRTFFIGAVIFIISGILLEKYIRELKYDGTNISSAG